MRRHLIGPLAFALLLAGCAATQPLSDITGRWSGTWSGHGVLDVPRDEVITLDLVQQGDAGQGRLVMNGALAADSVPNAIRNAAAVGIRVLFGVSENRVRLKHELGAGRFEAEMIVSGDRMLGRILRTSPAIHFDLTRVRQ